MANHYGTRHQTSKFSKEKAYRDGMEKFMETYCTVENNNGLEIHKVILIKNYHDSQNKIRKVEIGKQTDRNSVEKVIMLVGASGSGKSTLMNAMFNHILGVKWEDNFRFQLTDEEMATGQGMSETRCITAYTIHHQAWFKIPFTLTIVDTPGLGSTEGMARDKEITQQIKRLFSTSGANGIDRLDAVGFVSQSSSARLTPTQMYIFDTIQSMFDEDMSDNIFLLLTFSDAQKPPVLNAIKEANVRYNSYYTFNCAALYKSKEPSSTDIYEDDSDDDDYYNTLDKMFWDNGAEMTTKFLAQIENLEPRKVSLDESKDYREETCNLYSSERQSCCDETKLLFGNISLKSKEKQDLEIFKYPDTRDEQLRERESTVKTEKKKDSKMKPNVPTKKANLAGTSVSHSPKAPTKYGDKTYLSTRERLVQSEGVTRRSSYLSNAKHTGTSSTSLSKKKTSMTGSLPILNNKQAPVRDYPSRTHSNPDRNLQIPSNHISRSRSHSEAVESEEVRRIRKQLHDMIGDMRENIQGTRFKLHTVELIDKAKKMAVRLEEITGIPRESEGRPVPFSAEDYIETLLQSREEDMVTALDRKIAELEASKKQAEFLKDALLEQKRFANSTSPHTSYSKYPGIGFRHSYMH